MHVYSGLGIIGWGQPDARFRLEIGRYLAYIWRECSGPNSTAVPTQVLRGRMRADSGLGIIDGPFLRGNPSICSLNPAWAFVIVPSPIPVLSQIRFRGQNVRT